MLKKSGGFLMLLINLQLLFFCSGSLKKFDFVDHLTWQKYFSHNGLDKRHYQLFQIFTNRRSATLLVKGKRG